MTTKNESANGTVPPAVANRALSVRELEQSLPSPDEVAEQAAALRAASVQAISVADVNQMMAAVLAKAKEGDPKCTRLILDHLNSHKPQPERGRPPSQPPAAPIVLKPVEPEPPKAVAIPSAGVEQHRRLVAYILLAHQPMLLHALAQQTGLAGEELDAVLNHDWFKRDGSTVRLTPLGKNTVG